MQKPKIKDEITRLYCWQYTTSPAARAAAVYHEEVFINCDFLPRNVKDKSFIDQAQPAPARHHVPGNTMPILSENSPFIPQHQQESLKMSA